MALQSHIPLLVVCGPTASGKTALAVELALRLEGEVVSADSMQIYRKMDIGTAKPTLREQGGVPHHLFDVADPGESFSLVQYLTLARSRVAEIAARGRLPVLTGGTGLYLHSLVDNVQFAEIESAPHIRRELEEAARREGNAYLHKRLAECDPELAQKLHPNNLGRIIRALEVYQATGVPMSELQRRSRLEPSPYRLCMLGLSFRDREALYHRIDRRVDEMLDQGLEQEARALWRQGVSLTAGQAIGYKELFDCFENRTSLEEAVARIKLGTRRYAKRQLTWLRRDERIRWLMREDYPEASGLLEAALGAVRLELEIEPKH